MSILDRQQRPEVPSPVRVAKNLKNQAKSTYDNLVSMFNDGAIRFWANSNATPQEISDALGTDAREVFELHGKIGALLSTIDQQAILPGLEVVGQFSYNEDGTVTVVTAPTP